MIHEHRADFSHRAPMPDAPTYEFCVCHHIRVVWPSGTILDWHVPSPDKAAEARAIHEQEAKSHVS